MSKISERLMRCADVSTPISTRCDGCQHRAKYNCRGLLMQDAARALDKSARKKGAKDGTEGEG